MADIGEEIREIEVIPLTEPAPVPAPVPAAPAEPAPSTPEREPVPV